MSNFTNDDREQESYGFLDSSYKAAGEYQGLRKLCEVFYRNMETFPEAQVIREMHKESLEDMTEKLTLFLSMWLGGPKTYREKYQFVGMPQAHKNFIINEAEKDAWLICMDKAIDEQNYKESFKKYLKEQLRVPAEVIRRTSRNN